MLHEKKVTSALLHTSTASALIILSPEVEQELGSPAEADTAGVPERLTAGGVFLKAFVTTFLAEWGDRSRT